MKKRYILTGYLSYTVLLKDKNKYIRCSFEGGAVSGLGMRAASYTTDDKNIQNLLEKSKEFKSGLVKVDETYNIEPVQEDESPEAKVKTLQQARQFLMDMGVPMEELQTKAKVLEVANSKNISFPNW